MKRRLNEPEKLLALRILGAMENTLTEIESVSSKPLVLNDSEIALSKSRIQNSVFDRDLQLELIKKAQDGNKCARDQLLEHNLGLIFRHAQSRNGCEFVDLVQAGACGLLHAITKFDTSRKTCFSTYAVPWIKQSIQRYIDDHGTIIRLPVHIQENLRRLIRAKKRLQFLLGREPSISEIAYETGMKISAIETLLRYKEAGDMLPFESVKIESLESTVASIDSALMDDQRSAFIERILNTLEPREVQILKMRAGLGETEAPLSLEKIGEAIGMSREAVRQAEARAIKMLKAKFSDQVVDYLNS